MSVILHWVNERIPHEKIHEILKVSYDGLEEMRREFSLTLLAFSLILMKWSMSQECYRLVVFIQKMV